MMNEKDRLDGYLALAKHHAERHDKRREYEWKISFGIWGALLGALAIVKDVSLNALWFWIGGGAIYVIYALLWLPGIRRANEIDKSLWKFFRDQAADVLYVGAEHAPSQLKIQKPSWWAAFRDWSIVSQALITMALYVAIGVWLEMRPSTTAKRDCVHLIVTPAIRPGSDSCRA
jgi:hypothetical protein